MEHITLVTNEDEKPTIKQVNIENSYAVGRNYSEAQKINYSESSNNCVQNLEDPNEVLANEVKSEQVDISEHFIDENGLHDRNGYEIGTGQFFEARNPSNFKSELTHHQDKSDFYTAEMSSEKVSAVNGISENGGNSDLMKESSDSNQETYSERHGNTADKFVKKHECHLCEFATKRKSNLYQHIDSVHLNLKQHKCNFCDYATNISSTLKRHLNTVHLNIKKHVCQICEQAFRSKRNLKRHIDTVDSDLRGNIEQHMECSHLDSKRHKCQFCDYATNLNGTLKRHVDMVHFNIKKHICHLCEYACKSKKNLQRHMELIHFI